LEEEDGGGRDDDAADVLAEAGSGRYCSPRHWMSCDSRHDGSNCM
jgi:hypothetical protein